MQNFAQLEGQKTRQLAAEKAGFGNPETYRQARAIRRCGELLRQIEPGQGARDGKRHDGSVMPLNRTQAATDARPANQALEKLTR